MGTMEGVIRGIVNGEGYGDVVMSFLFFFFFFFKQKTAYEIVDCDWSSDVCSSDLQSLIWS